MNWFNYGLITAVACAVGLLLHNSGLDTSWQYFGAWMLGGVQATLYFEFT